MAGSSVPDAAFTADVGRDFVLADWSVRHEITTDLPDEVRETPGYAVGTGDVTLAPPTGAGRGHFTPVGLSVGHVPASLTATDGTVEASAFTGKVTGGKSSATSDSLDLSVEDRMASLRGAVDVPAIVATFRQSSVAVGLSAGWVMDTVLRQAGYYTTPPMEQGCIYSAPLQDSLWPEYPAILPSQITGNNSIVDGSPIAPVFESSEFGRYPTLAVSTCEIGAVEWATGDVLRFCFTQPGAPSLAYVSLDAIDATWSLGVEVAGSSLKIVADGSTVATTTAAAGRWCVELERTSSTGFDYTFTDQDGVAASGSGTVSASVGTQTAVRASILDGFNGVQVVRNPSGAETYTAHVTGTDLSASMNSLNAVPPGLTGKQKDVLVDLAAAEFGGFWMSVDGVPTFRNREDLLGVGSTPEVVSSVDSIADIGWSWSADSVRSAVNIPVTPITVTSGEPFTSSYMAVAWVADSAIFVPAGGTVKITLDLDVTVLGVDPLIRGITGSTPAAGSYFRANTSEDGSGATYTSGNRGRVTQTGPSRIEVTFTGGLTSRWLVDSDGEPAVTIRALVVARAADEQIVSIANAGVDADQLTLDRNMWRQDLATSRALAVSLASQLRSPVTTASSVRVVPNMNRRLGDVILLTDPVVTGLGVRCLVAGISRSGRAGELTETLTVRQLPWLISDFNADATTALISDFDTAYSGLTVDGFDLDPFLV